MLFCIKLSNFVEIRAHIVEMCCHAEYYFRFCICWCHCLQKVKVYQQTKFCWHISIDSWDITTSVLEKANVCHIQILFPVSISVITAIGMIFCVMMPNFIQIGPPAAEIWRHINFSRWRPRSLNTASGFVFVDVAVQKGKINQQTKFRRHISIAGWDITSAVTISQILFPIDKQYDKSKLSR